MVSPCHYQHECFSYSLDSTRTTPESPGDDIELDQPSYMASSDAFMLLGARSNSSEVSRSLSEAPLNGCGIYGPSQIRKSPDMHLGDFLDEWSFE